MKKLALLIMCVATMAFTSCSSLSNAASSNTAASASGVACGKALVSLYNVYRSTGTVDLTNSTNLSNTLAVITAYNQLRSNKDNDTYKNAFTSGMITSGSPYISQSNATTIANSLLNSAGLTGVNASNIQSKSETISTIVTLLNALKTN